eukprot:Awhi_evm1s14885
MKAPGIDENAKAHVVCDNADDTFQTLPTKIVQDGLLVDNETIDNSNKDIVYIIPEGKVVYLTLQFYSQTIDEMFRNETSVGKDNKRVLHQYRDKKSLCFCYQKLSFKATELDETIVDNNRDNNNDNNNNNNNDNDNHFPFFSLKVFPISKIQKRTEANRKSSSKDSEDVSRSDSEKVKISNSKWKQNILQKFASFTPDTKLPEVGAKYAEAGPLLFEKRIHYTTEAQLKLNRLKDVHNTSNVCTKRSKLSSSPSIGGKGTLNKSAAKR